MCVSLLYYCFGDDMRPMRRCFLVSLVSALTPLLSCCVVAVLACSATLFPLWAAAVLPPSAKLHRSLTAHCPLPRPPSAPLPIRPLAPVQQLPPVDSVLRNGSETVHTHAAGRLTAYRDYKPRSSVRRFSNACMQYHNSFSLPSGASQLLNSS